MACRLLGTAIMKASLLFTSVLVTSLVAACGGSVEGGGGGQPSGSSSSSGSSGSPSGPTPTPPPNTSTPAPAPVPEGWAAEAGGCGNFVVFASTAGQDKFLVINADREKLRLYKVGDSATVDFDKDSAGAELRVERFSSALKEAPYCTDFGDPNAANPTKYLAFSGSVTFTVTGQGRDDDSYAVSVQLKSVTVVGPNGAREALPDLRYANVGVGWFPG